LALRAPVDRQSSWQRTATRQRKETCRRAGGCSKEARRRQGEELGGFTFLSLREKWVGGAWADQKSLTACHNLVAIATLLRTTGTVNNRRFES